MCLAFDLAQSQVYGKQLGNGLSLKGQWKIYHLKPSESQFSHLLSFARDLREHLFCDVACTCVYGRANEAFLHRLEEHRLRKVDLFAMCS